MRDGIYRLKYETTTLNGSGVIELHDGVLSGCDRFYFMQGEYRENGNALNGIVTFKRHTEHASQGIPEQFKIVFDGICSDEFGQFDIRCPDIPQIRGQASFNWLASFAPA
jgi:hypothetical protein